MILTDAETNNLYAILWQINAKIKKKQTPRLTIENLCRRAMLILNKAGRKKQKATILQFKEGDI